MLEIWDAYDGQFNKIENVRLVRGEVVPEGMYHLVCEIIVKHTDGTYLLMQRDYKKNFGGMWELTAGGSALTNETPIACAVRELKEETGIESCNLQEGETVGYKWVDKTALLEMGMDELASSRTIKLVKELNI